MQPSIEEIALGALPGLPKVEFHWPLIEYSLGGAEFLEAFFKAERGELDPFVLVIEGSIANESIKSEGYWTGFGNEPGTDQPRTFARWIDKLAPKAWAVLAAGTCATYGGIHAMAGNPTGAMGILDYLGWDWKSQRGRADRVRPRLPDAARQPLRDDPLPAVAGQRQRADDSARRSGAADVAVRHHRARRLRPRAATTSRASSRPPTTSRRAW